MSFHHVVFLYFAGSSLVSIESAAESSFLSYRVEPLQSKTNFWIGLFRNVEGKFAEQLFNHKYFKVFCAKKVCCSRKSCLNNDKYF